MANKTDSSFSSVYRFTQKQLFFFRLFYYISFNFANGNKNNKDSQFRDIAKETPPPTKKIKNPKKNIKSCESIRFYIHLGEIGCNSHKKIILCPPD